MKGQTQNDHPLEQQPEATAPPAPRERPLDVPPTHKLGLTWEFVIGFLGWYVATALFFGQVRDQESLVVCGGLLFPINVVVLILLLKLRSQIGWGMLAALAVNMIMSLVLGLVQNALCFIPFFSGGK